MVCCLVLVNGVFWVVLLIGVCCVVYWLKMMVLGLRGRMECNILIFL